MEVLTIRPPEIVIDPEFRKLIPPLTAEELAQLEENLFDNGCREPLAVWYPRPECQCGGIVLWQGAGLFQCEGCGRGFPVAAVLLDGHNRIEICRRRGIRFGTVEIDDLDSRDDARAWIIRNQLGRRNLNESQRAMLAATLKDVFNAAAMQRKAEGQKAGGHARHGDSSLLSDLKARSTARDQAAAAMNVSSGLVHAAEKVMAHGSEKLQQAVMSDLASVSAAAEVATLPETEQDKAVDGGKQEIIAAARKVRQARRRKAREISPDALTPVRGYSKPNPKTALELPHDPIAAARTLISVFDREFLVGLVSEITLYLNGDSHDRDEQPIGITQANDTADDHHA